MENRHYEMEIEMIISYNLSLTIYEYRGKNRLFDNREAHSEGTLECTKHIGRTIGDRKQIRQRSRASPI